MFTESFEQLNTEGVLDSFLTQNEDILIEDLFKKSLYAEKQVKESEEFIKFLDNEFTPAIKLSEKIDSWGFDEKLEAISKPKLEFEQTSMNSTEASPKNNQRADVVYKNLLRNIRKSLWEKFDIGLSQEDIGELQKKSIYFEKFVTPFFSKYFKRTTEEYYADDEETQTLIFELLAVFISSFHSTHKKWEMAKRATNLLKIALKQYKVGTYKLLFRVKGVSALFTILKECGFIEDMINSHPKMSLCKGRYQMAVNSIINFPTCFELMK